MQTNFSLQSELGRVFWDDPRLAASNYPLCVRMTWNVLGFKPQEHLRKEVIQPQVPLRLPCYDFTTIISHTMGTCLPCGLAPATSSTTDFRGVTGGVYKARERIHRGVLIRDY